MRDYTEAGLGPRRFNLGLFIAFSLTGVLLAVFGLYALVSYAVSQRQHEIGLRMAIGATEGDIDRMILRQAILLGLAGVALGGCFATIARPLVSRLAQDVSVPFSTGTIDHSRSTRIGELGRLASGEACRSYFTDACAAGRVK